MNRFDISICWLCFLVEPYSDTNTGDIIKPEDIRIKYSMYGDTIVRMAGVSTHKENT